MQDGTKTYVYGHGLLYTADGTGPGQAGNITWHFGDKTGSTAVLMDNGGNTLLGKRRLLGVMQSSN